MLKTLNSDFLDWEDTLNRFLSALNLICYPHIYLITISETTKSTTAASYLDLLFTRDKNDNITTKLCDKHHAFGYHIANFPLCQTIFYQHQPAVYIHLSSFALPIFAQIIVTFYHATEPLWQDFCRRVTKLIVCPTHLRNSMADRLI